MEQNVLFKGIRSALVSCNDDNGVVYEDDMRRLMRWQISQGLAGFYICGGTGQGPALQIETRKAIAEIAVEEAKGKADVINHVGAIDLTTAVKLAKHAGEIGCDAISSVPPFFFGYDEQGICDYYKAIADASGLPVIMYASPLAGINITPKMIDRFMKEIPTLIGLKWTNPNYYIMHQITELNGGNINVINGPDETLICGLTMGAHGGIGSTYNLMPSLYVQLYEEFQKGNIDAARKLQYKINKIIEILLAHDCLASIKEILRDMGYETGYAVYPGKRLSPEEKEALNKDLNSARFYEDYYIV